jgi:hypothetical protein
MPLAEFRKKNVGAGDFGVIFDTFSMLRQIAQPIFDKTQVFSDVLHFAFFAFFAICDISEKNVKMSRFSQNPRRYPAQSVL